MTTIPLARCAHLLGIHPKTVCHWLTEANVPFVPHPTDARIKCVAEEHLLEIARRHRRPLPDLPSAPSLDACGAPGSREEHALSLPTHEGEPDHFAPLPSLPSASSASLTDLTTDLTHRVSCLETRLVTLQEQLAQLAVALLQERERTVEDRLATLESLVQSLAGRPRLPDVQEQGAPCAARREHRLHPAEQRARSRLPALIEYSAQGTYVIISVQEGELHLLPDSAEWFEWLATIPSFRFVGQQGRFTAYRHSRLSRSWRAHRVIHQREYKQTLGVTDHLTIQRLEQVAAALSAGTVI
jgi:hypothetical protein